MANKQQDFKGLGAGQIGALVTLHDPRDSAVGRGTAGLKAATPIGPWTYACTVIHVTALPAPYAAPSGDTVNVLVSNDGSIWFTLSSFTFSAAGTQELVLEQIKHRFLDVEIAAGATGSYLVNAWMAQR